MARRSRRRAPGRLTAVVLLAIAACTSGTSETTIADDATSTSPSTTTTTTLNTSSASRASSSTTTTPSTSLAPNGATTLVPEGGGQFPSVVLVHGGGWLVGDIATMEPLASFLTDEGFLTVNTTYQLSLGTPGFPGAIEDIACAIRYAAGHPNSNGEVTVIGHSAGAHIGAVASMTGDLYSGECEFTGGGLPDRFIGLSGPYDGTRVGNIMVSFFGSQQVDSPEQWDAGNPHALAGENAELRFLLIHGDIDQVVPLDFSENLLDDLTAAGSDAELVILEGVEHSGTRNPNIVGDIIVEWLRS